MEYRAEKFHHFTASVPSHNDGTHDQEELNKSTTTLSKMSTGPLRPSEKSGNVALNLCPDGSKINIKINGTTVNATKTSVNVTIGTFIISIGNHNAYTPIKEDRPISPSPPVVISVTLASFIKRNPLHVLLGDSLVVKATLSLSKSTCTLIQSVIIVFFYMYSWSSFKSKCSPCYCPF